MSFSFFIVDYLYFTPGFQLERLYERWKEGETSLLLSFRVLVEGLFIAFYQFLFCTCAGQERRDSASKAEDGRSKQILRSKTCETRLIISDACLLIIKRLKLEKALLTIISNLVTKLLSHSTWPCYVKVHAC